MRDIEKERHKFEAKYSSCPLNRSVNGGYKNTFVDGAWHGWLAHAEAGEAVATIECDGDCSDGSMRLEYDYQDIQRFPHGTKLFAAPPVTKESVEDEAK